jgi:hypothetical protein
VTPRARTGVNDVLLGDEARAEVLGDAGRPAELLLLHVAHEEGGLAIGPGADGALPLPALPPLRVAAGEVGRALVGPGLRLAVLVACHEQAFLLRRAQLHELELLRVRLPELKLLEAPAPVCRLKRLKKLS